MRLRSTRRAQAEIIGTLILILASALLASIVLYWGLALQGSGMTNFGQSVSRANAQAAEDISIDSVLFIQIPAASCSPSTNHCYTAIIYVRNYGSTPVKIAAVHIHILASGASVPSFDCEVTSSSSSTVHMVISALTMKPVSVDRADVTYPSGSPVLTIGGVAYSLGGSCVQGGSSYFSSTWDGGTVSIQVNTETGTSYHANYAVPQ